MIVEKIFEKSKTEPTKKAIIFQGRDISYAELAFEINKRATIFQTLISNKNVLLSQTDNFENLIDFLSLIYIGKVGIFVSSQITDSQLADLQRDTNSFLLDIQAKTKILNIKIESFSEVIPTIIKNEDLFLGVLTSGTESTPKIIWKDYQSWVSAFPHQSKVFGISENDTLFVLDALSYSANLNSALHLLWEGGTVYLTTLKSASTWHQQIIDNQVSSIFLVPSHYRLLVAKDFSCKQIKSLVSAGEKLDFRTAKALLSQFSEALLTEYYGAAELGHISFHQNQEIIDFGYSVGKPFPEVRIEIEDQKIKVESPYISPEYRGINTVLDLGYFEDGRLVLLGRAGRMFNRRGLNVFAEEIENKVSELGFVEEVAAIGKLRADGSHDIFLVFSSFADFPAENIKIVRKYLLDTLPPAKQPRKVLQIRNLPRKDIGKIDYQAVARIISEEDNYC